MHYSAYLVGGWVRDLLLGVESADIDVCVAGVTYKQLLLLLLAAEVEIILPVRDVEYLVLNDQLEDYLERQPESNSSFTAVENGVIKAKVRGRVIDFIVAGDSFKYNLECRDFTFNAMALPLTDLLAFDSYNVQDLIDYHGGARDLLTKTVRTVSKDPMICFRDDPVRLLRMIRFMLQFDMQMHQDIYGTLHENDSTLAGLYANINPSRTCNELKKIFSHESTVAAICALQLLPVYLRCSIFNHIQLNPVTK